MAKLFGIVLFIYFLTLFSASQQSNDQVKSLGEKKNEEDCGFMYEYNKEIEACKIITWVLITIIVGVILVCVVIPSGTSGVFYCVVAIFQPKWYRSWLDKPSNSKRPRSVHDRHKKDVNDYLGKSPGQRTPIMTPPTRDMPTRQLTFVRSSGSSSGSHPPPTEDKSSDPV